MWNPFLTKLERESARRGGQLMRQRNPSVYWKSRAYIWFCAAGCLAILVILLIAGAYWNAAALMTFWTVLYIGFSWLAAWDIRRGL